MGLREKLRRFRLRASSIARPSYVKPDDGPPRH